MTFMLQLVFHLSLWQEENKTIKQYYQQHPNKKKQAFPISQSQLCVTIWKLFFFFTQMKTAGCLTCCTNTSPEALPHTSEWESLAATNRRLFRGSLDYEALKPQRRYNGSNFTAPSPYLNSYQVEVETKKGLVGSSFVK